MTSSLNSRTPNSFPVRRMDYQFENIPRYWCNNDPALTHYFTALSTLFPEGESYFVRSVRALRKKIPHQSKLDREISAFIGQEAMHSKEHHTFHLSAQQHGLNPESLEKITGFILKTLEKILSKKLNLLVTVGLEHYTAVLVVTMMNTTHNLINDDTIRNLWLWHSIEETEHKAVAYDLYQNLYGEGLDAYIPRVSIFTFSLILITAMTSMYHLMLMKRDKQLFNLKSWYKFSQFAKTEYKIFLPKFLDYYRFSFHPNDTNELDLVQQTKIKIGLIDSHNALRN